LLITTYIMPRSKYSPLRELAYADRTHAGLATSTNVAERVVKREPACDRDGVGDDLPGQLGDLGPCPASSLA
jgi:hypothetical protein